MYPIHNTDYKISTDYRKVRMSGINIPCITILEITSF